MERHRTRRRLGLDLRHRRPHVIEELHLGRRLEASDRLPDGPADDVRLCQRRVETAGDPESLLDAERRPEHSALALDFVEHVLGSVGDVFAEHTDAFVGVHHLVQRESYGLAELHVGRVGSGVGVAAVPADFGRVGDVVEHAERVGSFAGQRLAGGGVDDVLGLGVDGVDLVAAQDAGGDQLFLEEVDGVVLDLVEQLFARAVLALGVGGRVRVGPRHLGVDQARPLAGADAGDGLGRPRRGR